MTEDIQHPFVPHLFRRKGQVGPCNWGKPRASVRQGENAFESRRSLAIVGCDERRHAQAVSSNEALSVTDCLAISWEVSGERSVQEVAVQRAGHFTRVDFLIKTAGINCCGVFETHTPEEWRHYCKPGKLAI